MPVPAADVERYIAANGPLIANAGLTGDDVRIIFKAVVLKNKVDIVHVFLLTGVDVKTDPSFTGPAARAMLNELVTDARFPVQDRLGLNTGSLRAYARKPGNWGENKAAWERKGVLNIPDRIGQRIEAYTVVNDGNDLAGVSVVDEVNKAFAAAGCKLSDRTCVQLTERDIVLGVGRVHNNDPAYPAELLHTYCRLFRPGCIEANVPPAKFNADISTAGAFGGARGTYFADTSGAGHVEAIAVDDTATTVRLDLDDTERPIGVIPAVDDFNGDGRTDLTVFPPSTGQWYVRGADAVTWGQQGDIPTSRWPLNG